MPSQPNQTDLLWLLGDEAATRLAELAESERPPSPATVARLRRSLPAERVHLLLEQSELRTRAREKFGPAAAGMYFTRKGLEQATDRRVAAWKAARFPADGALADLCCGIGGDLFALARRAEPNAAERPVAGPVGVDCDPVLAATAEANLHALGLPGEVLCRDVEQLDLGPGSLPGTESRIGDVAAWHIDPDRRADGRRTTRVEYHRPGPATIERLLEQCPAGAVKLAPAAALPPAWAERTELEWIGHRRECRQLVAWFGPLAHCPGQRRATVLPHGPGDHAEPRTIVAQPNSLRGQIEVAREAKRYIYEPHAAVLAAGVEAALAAEHELDAVAAGVTYYTSDTAIDDAAIARFEVREVVPLDEKRLRRRLAELDVGRLEIKVRGCRVEPARLRARLKPRGSSQATLLIAPIDGGVRAIVARRET